jgi:hypothetical protein
MLDDDGIGCPNGVTPGIGIAGMQEREPGAQDDIIDGLAQP